ncbi:hypothetical protein [Kitasatospora sp. NPDC085879]|uniref:hypothetical protein n=1 Tax=Kitasatospora sp. NPDC085879 TaxID=3154769 RepID=UPI0034318CCB
MDRLRVAMDIGGTFTDVALYDGLPATVAAASHGDSMAVMFADSDPRHGGQFVSLEATLSGRGAWEVRTARTPSSAT